MHDSQVGYFVPVPELLTSLQMLGHVPLNNTARCFEYVFFAGAKEVPGFSLTQ